MFNLTNITPTPPQNVKKEDIRNTRRTDFLDYGLGTLNGTPNIDNLTLKATHRGMEVVKKEDIQEDVDWSNTLQMARPHMRK